jgi:polysaccharide biosynthesis/export protein
MRVVRFLILVMSIGATLGGCAQQPVAYMVYPPAGTTYPAPGMGIDHVVYGTGGPYVPPKPVVSYAPPPTPAPYPASYPAQTVGPYVPPQPAANYASPPSPAPYPAQGAAPIAQGRGLFSSAAPAPVAAAVPAPMTAAASAPAPPSRPVRVASAAPMTGPMAAPAAVAPAPAPAVMPAPPMPAPAPVAAAKPVRVASELPMPVPAGPMAMPAPSMAMPGPAMAMPAAGPVAVPAGPVAYAPVVAPPDYFLDSGDRLRVVVFGQEGLTNAYLVDAAGCIDVPLIGQVLARGATTEELAHRIAARLRNGFIREPHVAVEVVAYRPFFILGEVTQPGQYPYVPRMTAETAVAIAGGFTPRAFRRNVIIDRPVAGRIVRMSVPPSFPLRPGDTVNVQERWF